MKILVIGNGGREHALAWKLHQSPKVTQIFVAKGNAGTGTFAQNLDIDPTDIKGLLNFAKEAAIDLTVVGPEDPLCLGIVDAFQAEGLKIFGPNQECAQFEASKDFTKRFLETYDIPTAAYHTVTDFEAGVKVLEQMTYPVVLKADGLALGKGVIIAQDEPQALETLDAMLKQNKFGESGHRVVIEEFLSGYEQSLICLVSNNRLFPLELAKDYKKAYDGDKGPNTGGVGCYSPTMIEGDKIQSEIETMLANIESGLDAEGYHYDGVLFIGLMITDKVNVLEFNVRFGDPETEALMPRLDSDLVTVMEKVLDHSLTAQDIQWTSKVCLGVVMTSEGYPESYSKGHEIILPESQADNLIVFHNGTGHNGHHLTNQGGRVLTVTALEDDLETARQTVYDYVENIQSDILVYRKDIGQN